MILSEEQFKEKLREEPDTDYIKALLELGKIWSQRWVIKALQTELEMRKHEWNVGLQHE